MYRSYDPEISRWTTCDPSGFPNGLNNSIFTNKPTSSFDPDGLIVINTFNEAMAYYQSNQGGSVIAGSDLIRVIKESSQFSTVHGELQNIMTEKLSNVPHSHNFGDIRGQGSRGMDMGFNGPLGSFSLSIDYSIPWQAANSWTPIGNDQEYRLLKGEGAANFGFNDSFDFTPNPTYNLWQNFWREYLPGAVYGSGTAFIIQGNFQSNFAFAAAQFRPE